jgi:hypothetical protein
MARSFWSLLFIGLTAAALLGPALPAQAAMGTVSSFTFRGLEEDLTSPAGVFETDGIGDGRFSVVLTGIGAITGLTLSNADAKLEWFASSGAGARGMRVRDNGGNDIVEAGGSLPLLPILGSLALDLAIPGKEGSLPIPQGEYEIAVRFIDGSESRARTTVNYRAKETEESRRAITEALLLSSGEARGNYVGPSEELRSAGSADRAISLKLSGSGRIRSIQVLSVRGRFSAWDTTPGNGRWLVAVEDNGQIVNDPNGTVDITFRESFSGRLWIEDNGAIAAGDTTFKIVVEFSDGEKLESPVTLSTGDRAGGGLVRTFAFQGQSEQDLVGDGERPGSDGRRDWRFRLDLSARGTLIAATLSLGQSLHQWDTLAANDIPLLAVTDGEGYLLNRPDGTIRVPLYGETTLFLLASAPSGVFNARGGPEPSLRLVFDDGRIIETTGTVRERPSAPGPTMTARTVDLPGRDMTTSSEILVGDGRPDHAVRLTFASLPKGSRLIELSLKPRGTGHGWDTVPGSGHWALAVTDREGNILNGTDGSLSLSVGTEETLILWLTDDGALANRGRPFLLRALFADGTTLEAELQR